MSVNSLKAVLKYILNKSRFSGARVAFGSTLAGECELGRSIEIEPDCYIHNAHIGDNVQIRRGCSLFDVRLAGPNVIYQNSRLVMTTLGAYSYIAEGANANRVNLGRFCSIGPSFKTGFGNHPTTFVSTHPVFYSTRKQCGITFTDKSCFDEDQTTYIGHDVWIGSKAQVMQGVTIGTGAVIGAGAIVTKNVEPYTIVGGVPAKPIRKRFDDESIALLMEWRWWELPIQELDKWRDVLFTRNWQENLSKRLGEAPRAV